MVYGGQDTEINNRIGNILLEIMPDGTEDITATATVGEDWAEVGIKFTDPQGQESTFDFDDVPDIAIADISEELVKLREVMGKVDAEPWNGATFKVTRDGGFRVEFSYEPIEDE